MYLKKTMIYEIISLSHQLVWKEEFTSKKVRSSDHYQLLIGNLANSYMTGLKWRTRAWVFTNPSMLHTSPTWRN